jgi:plastocyanin
MKPAHVLAVLTAITVFAAPGCKNDDDLTAIRPGTLLVAARDSFFQPDTITIDLGFPVRWTNEGTVYHTVVSDSALWGSTLLAPTWWFEVTFDSAGTFPYHCSEHDNMVGVVIAQ